MVPIVTPQGRRIEIIFQFELCDPMNMGEYVRAYCHIHGSDHQRSLSINKRTGWGHCFNAACNATVLVGEWNPVMARHLLDNYYQGLTPTSSSASYRPLQKQPPLAYQPILLYPPKTPPEWQQDELAALLALDEQMRAELAASSRAREYLEERGIPLEIALAEGVCYLSPALLNRSELQKKRGLLYRWVERILFPLGSPYGKGYIGRSLWRWQPGMDENAHKALLDAPRSPKRWIKTNPAGWFGYDPTEPAALIILVEGAFDRLTLIRAGFKATEVIALAGTAACPDWFPPDVNTITLALDADEGGKDAAQRLAERLMATSRCVKLCPPPQDECGKDWNERWRRRGIEGLRSIFEAYADSC